VADLGTEIRMRFIKIAAKLLPVSVNDKGPSEVWVVQASQNGGPSATPLPAGVLKKRRADNPREQPAEAGVGTAAVTEYP